MKHERNAERRNQYIMVRVSRTEKQRYIQKANRAGFDALAEFVRAALEQADFRRVISNAA